MSEKGLNHNITIKGTEVLADNWGKLSKVTYEFSDPEGKTQRHTREVYERGNGAVILLYNPARNTVILTKQFRIPTYLNGNKCGMLVEACAGVLDGDHPEECIKRETEEETGYKLSEVQKIFEAYMTPGSVTELLHFYVGQYSDEMKVNEGGGLDEEQENIEVLELDFPTACEMMTRGEIKDSKTIILLQYAQIHKLLES